MGNGFTEMKSEERILIICEDAKSSKAYFQCFNKDDEFKRNGAVVVVNHPKNHHPLGLVKAAVEEKKESDKLKKKNDPDYFDHIWVVLDRDHHENIAEAYNLAKAKGICFGLSVICFEYWLLLHFQYSTKPYDKCADLIKDLKKVFPDYEKSKECFGLLKDKMNIAIEHGTKLEKQMQPELLSGKKIYELGAYTNIHHLVAYLSKPYQKLKNCKSQNNM